MPDGGQCAGTGKRRTALVLSGGGMFGAYQAGVWKALEDVFRPDIVIGASAGALNAWAIAGGCSGDGLIRTWLDPAAALPMRLRLWQGPWRGLLDARALEEGVRRMVAEFQPRQEIGIAVVELPGLRRRLFRGAEIGPEHLLASCAVPCGFPPRWIGGKLCADGGLLGALPLWAASEMGANGVVAVDVLAVPPSPMLRYGVRMLQALAPRAPDLPGDVDYIAISPNVRLGTLRDTTLWSRANVERWIELGRRDAEKQLPAVIRLFSTRDG